MEGLIYSDSSVSSTASYSNDYSVSIKTELSKATAAGQRQGTVKYCGVCGDIAKSFHFGGLSCDSCKAFFRRSVQKDNYLNFHCTHQGCCVISLSNRKSCQYCRMKGCFNIGMEKSWVMTEEERKALMKARAEKKLVKQQQQEGSLSKSSSPCSFNSEDESYVPQISRMNEFMEPLEIKEIESVVTKYVHAYKHVPYNSALHNQSPYRPGAQVMEMFGTLVRRFAYYARMMPDFVSLPYNDQTSLLKGGVLEMCLLRGALVFDPATNCWPNMNMPMYMDTPVLNLDSALPMTSSKLFQMHMEFIRCIQMMNVDEPIIMLLSLIVLFSPERKGLACKKWIERYQIHYTHLLERYMNWRFGFTKSRYVFGKLLTKLSDLRELSDTHNKNNLHLGRDEVSSIQNQMQNLKLNPYPELPVVSESNKSSNQGLDAPSGSSSSSNCYESSLTIGCQHASISSHPIENSSIRTPAAVAQNGSAASNNYCDYEKFPQQLQQQQSWATGDHLMQHQQQNKVSEVQQQHHQQNWTIAGEEQAAHMAYQFMQVMEKSVNQIVNVPHFGLEWVTPDYQFDPIDLIGDERQVSPEQEVVVEEPPKALTPHTMKDLFDALEEYSNLLEL